MSTALGRSIERTLAVNGVTKSIDNTAEQLRADRDINLNTTVSMLPDNEAGTISLSTRENFTHNLTGTLDSLTLLDETVGTEEHNTDLAGLKVHAHTLNTGGEPMGGLEFRFSKCQDFGEHILD